MTVARQPPKSHSPWMRSRVTPGVSRTSAFRLPISRLKSVDLPTLGRPTMATTGIRTARSRAPRGPPAGPQRVEQAAGRRLRRLHRHAQMTRQIGGCAVVEEHAPRLLEGARGHEDRVAQPPAGPGAGAGFRGGGGGPAGAGP